MATLEKRALIIEDDLDLAALVAANLRSEGFIVRLSHEAESALAALKEVPFTLAVIDRNLPDIDGIEICKHIRSNSPNTGIIMLTCLGRTSQRIEGLEAGADDYITKPFSIDELVARVHSVMRRAAATPAPALPTKIKVGDLLIDLQAKEVYVKGQKIVMTETEFDLLAFLAQHPGKKFSRTELLHSVWGYTLSGYEHTVNTHITRVRSKVGDDPAAPRYILTVWGVGYQFAGDASFSD